jgi:hypothetical protein
MSTVFDRIFTRFFGRDMSPNMQTTQMASQKSTKVKKSVRIQEEFNEVILIQEVENFIEGKQKENRLRERALKLREQLHSVEKKPFVPPVGTVLQMFSPRKNLLMAVVVLPDHRLLEVQRGGCTGMHLHPRFVFNTPYEWQCWVNRY